jgi:hypothetical protein
MKVLYNSERGASENEGHPPIGNVEGIVDDAGEGDSCPLPKSNRNTDHTHIPSDWVVDVSTTYVGILPNDARKKAKLEEQSNTQTDYFSVAYLCFLIVATRGYNKYLRFHSAKLKRLLGPNYRSVLGVAQSCGLIKWKQKPTKYDKGDCSKKHNQIMVIGRKGSWSQVKIEEPFTINRIYQYRLSRVSTLDIEVLRKEYYSLTTSRLDLAGFDEFNLALSCGDCLPNRCGFGNRVHCLVTYSLTKKERKQLRYIYALMEPTCEVDITSSQPYFLFQCVSNPQLLQFAIKDTEERSKLVDVFKANPWSAELKMVYGEALNEGEFYGKFLSNMLEGCCEGLWLEWLRQKLKREKKPKDKIMPRLRRDRIKKVFMYLMFGGGTKLLRMIQKNRIYGPFAYLILQLRKVKMDRSGRDFYGVKKFRPRKIIALVLQRIEAEFIHRVYTSSGISWGILIHDSVLCLEKEQQMVVEAFNRVSKKMGINMPVLKY